MTSPIRPGVAAPPPRWRCAAAAAGGRRRAERARAVHHAAPQARRARRAAIPLLRRPAGRFAVPRPFFFARLHCTPPKMYDRNHAVKDRGPKRLRSSTVQSAAKSSRCAYSSMSRAVTFPLVSLSLNRKGCSPLELCDCTFT